MMKAFLVEMNSDFAHWRNPFSISILETFLLPQKTGALGILGAMAGLNESEIEKLQGNIKVGMKLKKLGGVILDLTTLINLKEVGLKTPTSRQLLYKPIYTFLFCGEERDIDPLLQKVNRFVYPVYAGISDALAEVRIREVGNVEVYSEKGINFLNVSIPYEKEKYEWVLNPNGSGLIIPPRVIKKTLLFRRERSEKEFIDIIEKEFIDIIEGYNVIIKPSWKVNYVVIDGEFFPIF